MSKVKQYGRAVCNWVLYASLPLWGGTAVLVLVAAEMCKALKNPKMSTHHFDAFKGKRWFIS